MSAMQLVKIDHERCGEYNARTFIAAPAAWDRREITKRVRKAQAAYLEEYAKVTDAENGPPSPGYQPNYAKSPDRLVRDVLAEHVEAKAAYETWQAMQRRTRLAFENFLMEQGFVSLWSDDSGAVEIEVGWGHRHGQRLSYGADEIDTMPSPARLAGIPDLDDDDFG